MLEVLGGFQEANPPDPPPARRLRSQDPAGESRSPRHSGSSFILPGNGNLGNINDRQSFLLYQGS